jgi:hypothetical protein
MLGTILCTCFDPILALLCDGYFLRILKIGYVVIIIIIIIIILLLYFHGTHYYHYSIIVMYVVSFSCSCILSCQLCNWPSGC